MDNTVTPDEGKIKRYLNLLWPTAEEGVLTVNWPDERGPFHRSFSESRILIRPLQLLHVWPFGTTHTPVVVCSVARQRAVVKRRTLSQYLDSNMIWTVKAGFIRKKGRCRRLKRRSSFSIVLNLNCRF